MTSLGNMIPYIASYMAKQNDGQFNNGLVVWLTAAPFLTQGIVMPFGGMLAAKIGSKLVVMFGSVICRYVIYASATDSFHKICKSH